MISKNQVHAACRPQLGQFRPGPVNLLRPAVPLYVISGADDEFFFQRVGFLSQVPDDGQRHQRPVVQVRQMDNGETLELRGQTGERNVAAVDLKSIPRNRQ